MRSIFEKYVACFIIYILFTAVVLTMAFLNSLSLPFQLPMSTRSMLPQGEGKSPKISTKDNPEKKIKYYQYTANGDTYAEKLIPLINNSSRPSKYWMEDVEIKVIVHGYHIIPTYTVVDVVNAGQLFRIAEAYATYNKSYNIIVMDWTPLAIQYSYPDAASNVKPAGENLAQFLMKLWQNEAFTNWDMVHVIGFSLGAHLAGVTGLTVKKLADGQKIGRITGIDPAGPAFDPPNGKMPSNSIAFLDKKDAKFVDIIHCNMGLSPHWTLAKAYGAHGSVVQAGHVDFYPNGGSTQNFQCTFENDVEIGCSHKYCSLFYANSLLKPIVACPCKSWTEYKAGKCKCDIENGGVYLGEHCSKSARGRYYLYTKDKIDMSELMTESADNVLSSHNHTKNSAD